MMDKIPKHFVDSLNKTVQIDTSTFQRPIDAIMAERNKNQRFVPPQNPNMAPPAQPQQPPPMVEIDGYILPLDSVVMWMFIIANAFSRDPYIRKILDVFKFKFADVNGKVIYPKPISRKAKHKKKKSKK